MNDAEWQIGDNDDWNDFDDGVASAEDNDNDSDECDGEKDHRYFWLATEILKAILWIFHALESAERLNMAERFQLFLKLIHFKQKQKNNQIRIATCKYTPDALLWLIFRWVVNW